MAAAKKKSGANTRKQQPWAGRPPMTQGEFVEAGLSAIVSSLSLDKPLSQRTPWNNFVYQLISDLEAKAYAGQEVSLSGEELLGLVRAYLVEAAHGLRAAALGLPGGQGRDQVRTFRLRAVWAAEEATKYDRAKLKTANDALGALLGGRDLTNVTDRSEQVEHLLAMIRHALATAGTPKTAAAEISAGAYSAFFNAFSAADPRLAQASVALETFLLKDSARWSAACVKEVFVEEVFLKTAKAFGVPEKIRKNLLGARKNKRARALAKNRPARAPVVD